MPHTGRNHQIRVHLQHLGHPIANDPIYGKARSSVPAPAAAGAGAVEKNEFLSEDMKALEIKCNVCETTIAIHDTMHMEIWLHALQYRTPTHTYEVPAPVWASPNTLYPRYTHLQGPGESDKLDVPK